MGKLVLCAAVIESNTNIYDGLYVYCWSCTSLTRHIQTLVAFPFAQQMSDAYFIVHSCTYSISHAFAIPVQLYKIRIKIDRYTFLVFV
jgi:hypothetical protein